MQYMTTLQKGIVLEANVTGMKIAKELKTQEKNTLLMIRKLQTRHIF